MDTGGVANTATWGFQRIHEFVGSVGQSWECDTACIDLSV